MSILIRRFRSWWQPPRRAGNRIEHRQVTFLELFYDLVYVALVAQLSHALSSHIGWSALGGFAFLFVIVWWAWLNGSLYHDLHGNNDIRTRVFTFLQMISVVAMAVFAHDALGESSTGFALSYAAFQLILTYMWWRTGVHDPDHRPQQSYKIVITWFYLHLPLTIGITTVGASVLNVVEHAGEHLPAEVRWLILTATALVLVTTALLTRTTQILPEHQRIHDIGRRGLFISAVLIMVLGFIPMNTIPLLSAIALLLLMPIFFGLRVWVEIIGTDDEMDTELDIE